MALTNSAQVRRHIVKALRADLLGPFTPENGTEDATSAEELWDLAPSKRYLTGFLVPTGQPQIQEDEEDEDALEDDQLEAGSDPSEESQDDPQAKRRPLLPSSIGMSVLLPPGQGDSLQVRVTYADYVPEPQTAATLPADSTKAGKKQRGRPPIHWRRVRRNPIELDLPLDSLTAAAETKLGDSGLRLYGHLDAANRIEGLADGARPLSLFVVNTRPPSTDAKLRDQTYVFQVTLEVRYAGGLVPRPDLAGKAASDWDDRVMELQFRDALTYASGHGVAVIPIEEDGRAVGARTEWLPEASVKRVTTREVDGVTTNMDALADLGSAEQVHAALAGLPEQYGAWLTQEHQRLKSLAKHRQLVATEVLQKAERARDRIREGIELLAQNPTARQSFTTANRSMAMAARQRNPERYRDDDIPRWRLFQLAFILLNLPSVTDPSHDDRETVELIFFPTGGGKTEAYLGVIAFALVWRRLTGAARPDRGLGVAVLLRYTLRLLTLDQLGRAATLICALEMLRRKEPELGDVRFSLGLWVGKSATANRLTHVARQISDYRNRRTNSSPFPLPACPWCGKEIPPDAMLVRPNQKNAERVDVGCGDFTCAFSQRNGGIPVQFVDEQIYRELPSFLVATVDKFAMLPWRGESGALFGQVRQRLGDCFVGPCTPPPASLKAKPVELPEGLRPPEIIVQDELHLISGPLGTMVGLYETAVESLCARPLANGRVIKPKIIASTATVKRAMQQIQALFGRDDMAMFPPPGIDDGESFFAQVDNEANQRLYLGVAASGRSAKVVLVRVYSALLAAAARAINPAATGDELPADPYLTLVGYFNNLRELGGMRRLVEDLVHARTASRGELKPIGAEENPWMVNRVLEKQPTELTSRESTSAIAATKRALGEKFGSKEFIPTVLASNMISVGVDIDRLGLMVVAGQPVSTSEYIQATSRVGRDDARPGLVVTCYNLYKPRDRSYYEHFKSYHESFYRRVEATSVTPFSGPALQRGLAGCLVAMTRHGDLEMTPPTAVMDLDPHRETAMRAIEALAKRAEEAQPGAGGEDETETGNSIRFQSQRLLDRWDEFISKAKAGGAQRCYSPYDVKSTTNPVLQTALEELQRRQTGQTADDRFKAPTSMRDVEPTVELWLRPAGGQGRRRS